MADTLTTYLNDHIAGSVAALELLDHLIDETPDAGERATLTALRTEIARDQETLQRLLHRVGGGESTVRKAAAWLSEKAARAKLRLDDLGDGRLYRLESLETLALGIEGKRGLWRALAVAADGIPPLAGFALTELERRAAEQHAEAERLRLDAARAALGPGR